MMHSLALAVGCFIVLTFLALCVLLVYMVGTMLRDGWRHLFGPDTRRSIVAAPPNVWPPPPEPGYVCRGRAYPRVRYGEEDGVSGAQDAPCPCCDAVAGQYHARGCIAEQCPVCGESAATCGCDYERFDTILQEARP